MRNRVLTGALLLGGLALAACGSENPVQPSTPGEGGSDRPPTAELAVASNTWLIKANMPIRRIHTAIATVPNSKGQSVVYVIGGWSSSGYPTLPPPHPVPVRSGYEYLDPEE